MENSILLEIVLLFVLSIGVVLVCYRFKLPSIVGFLLTGVLCGPSALGVVSNEEVVNLLADVGIAFLMFSIGMEMSGKELVRLKKPLFVGGSMQLAMTLVLCIVFFLFFRGINFSIAAGCMLTLSSTAIVLSLLQQKGQTESPQGRMCLGILIFQDLAIVPMVLILPMLAGNISLSWESASIAVGKGLGVIVAIFLFGHYILPKLMFRVVNTRSSELMMMMTLGLCLAVALLTSWVGLSLSLGAFLAGLLLAESEYSLNTLESILPFKEVFSSIFFMSVGMLLDINFFFSHLLTVFLVAVMIIVIKIASSAIAVCSLRYPLRTALLTGFSLAQIGEFSFVLAKSAIQLKLMTDDDYQIFLAASILTMVLTPVLINMAPKVSELLIKKQDLQNMEGKTEEEENEDDVPGIIRDGKKLKNHIIIVGFGIGGKIMAEGAKANGIPYIISEMNPETVKQYRELEPIRHGDASYPLVLEHLGAATARVMVVMISDPASGRGIIANARQINPSLHIVVRTKFFSSVEAFKKLGANDVIPEEYETSLEVFALVLHHYLVPHHIIDRHVTSLRQSGYAMNRTLDVSIMNNLPELRLSALTVGKDSSLIGKSIGETEIRKNYGINIAGIRSGETINNSPNADTIFHEGDVVYVIATAEIISKRAVLFQGTETSV